LHTLALGAPTPDSVRLASLNCNSSAASRMSLEVLSLGMSDVLAQGTLPILPLAAYRQRRVVIARAISMLETRRLGKASSNFFLLVLDQRLSTLCQGIGARRAVTVARSAAGAWVACAPL
jgi:hypothetical protein